MSEIKKSQGPNIAFIHTLRGIAPLFVITAHLGGWWLMVNKQESLSWRMFEDVVVKPFHLYQNGGHLGVVIFFIISGFIISHVLRRESRLEFSIKRFFRLVPTLWIGVFLMAAAAQVATHYQLGPILGNYASSLHDYFMSAFLLDIVRLSRAISLSVTWSLFVEVIFYLVVLAMMPRLKSRPVLSTIELSTIFLLIMIPHKVSPLAARMMYFTVYLPLLVIGRCFYLKYSGIINERTMWKLIAFNFMIFALLHTSRFDTFFQTGYEPFITYVISIYGFYIAMDAGIKKTPFVLSFIADISYALYMVHLPVGMLSMNVMASWSMPFLVKFSLALAVSIVVATIVTHFVEKPSQRFSRYLVKRFNFGLNEPGKDTVRGGDFASASVLANDG